MNTVVEQNRESTRANRSWLRTQVKRGHFRCCGLWLLLIQSSDQNTFEALCQRQSFNSYTYNTHTHLHIWNSALRSLVMCSDSSVKQPMSHWGLSVYTYGLYIWTNQRDLIIFDLLLYVLWKMSGQWNKTCAVWNTHTLTASWKHKYFPQLWDIALFFAYPTERKENSLCLYVGVFSRMLQYIYSTINHVTTGETLKTSNSTRHIHDSLLRSSSSSSVSNAGLLNMWWILKSCYQCVLIHCHFPPHMYNRTHMVTAAASDLQ